MKNLKLLTARQVSTIPADSFCVDIDKNVFVSSSKFLYSIESSSNQALPCANLISEIDDPESYIVGMEFLFESNSIFIAASSGDLYMYNVDDIEISAVGFVETSIEDFSWSPDQEFLVLLTGAGTLILMTKEFDALTENSLCTDEFGESKPINVGWGSKTTQFHGSEGKGAAHIKQKEPQQTLSYDDCKSRISWRKDGEYFVTSSVDKSKGYRLLRIWSQAAVLQYTSEIVEGLEEPVCWRPSGNVIACSQQCPNKHQIIFFEKNGLRHGEFTLPFKPNTFKVSTLQWNSDSSILLVVAEEICDNPTDFHVMLWTSSNYHWFLKQKFLLNIYVPYKPLITKWSSFHPNELQCYNQSTGEFYTFKWTWCIFQGFGNNGCEDSIVASIDNEKLLISPFGKLVVPPPLCGYMFSLTSSIHAVFFAPNIPAFAVYLGDSRLVFFKKGLNSETSEDCSLKLVAAGGNGFKSQVQPYSFLGSYNFKLRNDNTPVFGLCHFTWTDDKILCVAFCNTNNLDSRHCILSFDAPSDSAELNVELSGKILTELDNSVIGMTSNANGDVVALLLDDGKVFQIKTETLQDSSDNGFLLPWLCDDGKPLILPQLCPNMSVISIGGKDYFLGLSEKYNLFCNDNIIFPGCTSYYIHEEFLLITTIDNVLKCFSKKSDLLGTVMKNSALSSEVQSQKVEKGARIIIAPFKTTSVILQMPRGNLETIHPRALVLSAICSYLDNLQFGKAFDVAKRQRIDLNILYDHNPQQFLDHVERVIDQIDSSSDLNLLLASLKKEDVRIAMYPLSFKECVKHATPENMQKTQEEIRKERYGPSFKEWFLGNTSPPRIKINIICDAFRKILDAKNDNRYYHTLLATYVKKDPSELDEALIRLKAFKDSNDLKSTRDTVDSALNFLLYLVNVQELRDTALGTYDLEIAIMVEQKSQKDPKEFLPFYNALQQMEENYRKYKIDMHLHRYKKALLHISKCDDKFSECLELIKDQRLYTEALNIFPNTSQHFKAVSSEYGDYLITKRYFDEAGFIYSRCGMHEKALLAFKDSLNWQMVLFSSLQLEYTESRTIELCLELSAKLKSAQKYSDASYLLENFVKDPEEAIVTLVEGCEWNMAILTMSKYKREDLAESHLIPALKEHHTYLSSQLDQMSDTFSKYTERLKLVRTQKLIKAKESGIMMCEEDLFSEVASVGHPASSIVESKQSGSIVTRKSSKSRRKQKIKKYRLKEGSANEDLALVAALSEIIAKADALKDNFSNTLKAMVHFGFVDNAKALQRKMTRIDVTILEEIPNIWFPPGCRTAPEMKFGPDSTANSIAATLQESNKSTTSLVEDPELAAPSWRNMDITLQMLK